MPNGQVSTNSNVGIGTSNPNGNLHITQTAGTPLPFFLVDYSGAGWSIPIFSINGANVGIGIGNPTSKLHLAQGDLNITDGKIIIQDGINVNFKVDKTGLVLARELKIHLNTIPPDYVFSRNYKLMKIIDLKSYISKHKHLPNIPSAAEMESEGNIDVGAMQLKLLEKVEELTLYIIALDEENKRLKMRISKLEKNGN